MYRRTGALAGTALLGILLVVATALWSGLINPAPTPVTVATGPAPTGVTPSVGVATGAPSPSAPATAPPPPASTAAMRSDFNGDGFADLAIGVPRWDLGVFTDAGGVHVVYGSIAGLREVESQFWTRDTPDVLGSADGDDEFGSALASGDFDGDGYADLAVGAPDHGTGTNAGGVNVLFGSPAGLASVDNELWLVADLLGTPDNDGIQGGLGSALASGDFDGDGFDDLAIGSPAPGRVPGYVVALLHGGAEGLGFRGNWLAEAGVLAAGDLNGDGRDDLAVSGRDRPAAGLPSSTAADRASRPRPVGRGARRARACKACPSGTMNSGRRSRSATSTPMGSATLPLATRPTAATVARRALVPAPSSCSAGRRAG